MELKPSCFFMLLFLDLLTSFKCQRGEFSIQHRPSNAAFRPKPPNFSRSGIARSISGTCRSVLLTTAYQHHHSCLLNHRTLISLRKTSPKQQSGIGTRIIRGKASSSPDSLRIGSTMGSSGPADGDPVVLDKESVTGQFVRTAVCLSAITLKPLKIENIRQHPSIQLTGRLLTSHARYP